MPIQSARQSAQHSALEKTLSYDFTDQALLTQALSHSSIGQPNNERLEYLGDSVVGFYIAQFLFHRFPQLPEGQLTRLRASLVNKTTLAELARELNLGEYLKMGAGELKSGGFKRDSTLSNAFEALIGAIYLDGGLDRVFRVLDGIYASLKASTGAQPQKDNKTRLQEYLQKTIQSLPVYELTAQSGDPHNLEFTVSCQVDKHGSVFSGSGKSRKIAEQNAAAKALKTLLEE